MNTTVSQLVEVSHIVIVYEYVILDPSKCDFSLSFEHIRSPSIVLLEIFAKFINGFSKLKIHRIIH